MYTKRITGLNKHIVYDPKDGLYYYYDETGSKRLGGVATEIGAAQSMSNYLAARVNKQQVAGTTAQVRTISKPSVRTVKSTDDLNELRLVITGYDLLVRGAVFDTLVSTYSNTDKEWRFVPFQLNAHIKCRLDAVEVFRAKYPQLEITA
jgi:hypothetical protein